MGHSYLLQESTTKPLTESSLNSVPLKLVLFFNVCTGAGRSAADRQPSQHRRSCSKALETLRKNPKQKKQPTGVDLEAPNP